MDRALTDCGFRVVLQNHAVLHACSLTPKPLRSLSSASERTPRFVRPLRRPKHVVCDLQPILTADIPHRLLGQPRANGLEEAHSPHLIGNLVDATGLVTIAHRKIEVCLETP